MLTARNQNEDLSASLRAGANDFLVKPVDRETLVLRVNQLLNLRDIDRQRRQLQRDMEETARLERRAINANLHDHMGASLVDLKFASRDVLALDPDNALFRRLCDLVDRTAAALRP